MNPEKRRPYTSSSNQQQCQLARQLQQILLIHIKSHSSWRDCRIMNTDSSSQICRRIDLDHTADVQLHAWGGSLKEAFEQVGLAMFNYMTPVDALCVDDACTR
eukprot:GHUV01024138.1.p2 GENE.GHUV01024138.1~~GHUV01024138.1.p2  ORF type:complete len:103 (+),score=38.52 GHUV01024138.1:1227-1535(+)